jgi:hypothetical protein
MRKRPFKIIFFTILITLLLTACSQELIQPITRESPEHTSPTTTNETPETTQTTPVQESSSDLPTQSPQIQTTANNQVSTPETARITEAPTDQPPDAPQSTQVPIFIQSAIRNLMSQFNLSQDMIAIQSIEMVEWPDTSLGCPLPGTSYRQTITPGYLVTLQALDITYTYHTDTDTKVILCSDAGYPILPGIPIPTDEEIMDGVPWVPVD